MCKMLEIESETRRYHSSMIVNIKGISLSTNNT